MLSYFRIDEKGMKFDEINGMNRNCCNLIANYYSNGSSACEKSNGERANRFKGRIKEEKNIIDVKHLKIVEPNIFSSYDN